VNTEFEPAVTSWNLSHMRCVKSATLQRFSDLIAHLSTITNGKLEIIPTAFIYSALFNLLMAQSLAMSRFLRPVLVRLP
jgi:hypothetical protein